MFVYTFICVQVISAWYSFHSSPLPLFNNKERVMKTINKETAKKHIYATNGKIFSAVFTKKNGFHGFSENY